jgi:uncharacterized protein
MDLWIAFILGLAGSFHCLGMCGPLALALPVTGNRPAAYAAGRLSYNAGRVITYAAIGVVFGLAGKTLLFAGLQRWLSIGVGVLLLVGFFASRRLSLTKPITVLVAWLKHNIGWLLRRPGMGAMLALGVLNGFLPCGLVYVAAAGAATTADAAQGAAYMTVFGLGTVPMMFGVAMSGRLVPISWRAKLPRLIPFAVCLVATLLILRGMSLGIPYVSPALSGSGTCCPAAH